MLSHEYDTMFELEDTYWWYVGRRRLVSNVIEKFAAGRPLRILDVGCGTGANAAAFSRFGHVVGVDRSERALQYCREQRGVEAELGLAERLPFADSSFDVVTALDVIEHADNDVVVLQELRRVCKPDGLLVATVPAYGFLWSEHDEALQHRRRYVAHRLRMRAMAAGFEVLRTTYFISLLFFPILAVRLWQGLFKKSLEPKTAVHELPSAINGLLIGILAVEQWLTRFMNLPFGVSIFLTARPQRAQVQAIPVQLQPEALELP